MTVFPVVERSPRVVAAVTPRVPVIDALPEALIAATLVVPVTPRVPATSVFPLEAATLNLLVLTAKSPVTARVPGNRDISRQASGAGDIEIPGDG